MLLAGATMPTVSPGRRAGGLIREVDIEDMFPEAYLENERDPRRMSFRITKLRQTERSNSKNNRLGTPTLPFRAEILNSLPYAPSGFRQGHAHEPATPPCSSPSRPPPTSRNLSPTIVSLRLRARRNEP